MARLLQNYIRHLTADQLILEEIRAIRVIHAHSFGVNLETRLKVNTTLFDWAARSVRSSVDYGYERQRYHYCTIGLQTKAVRFSRRAEHPGQFQSSLVYKSLRTVDLGKNSYIVWQLIQRRLRYPDPRS